MRPPSSFNHISHQAKITCVTPAALPARGACTHYLRVWSGGGAPNPAAPGFGYLHGSPVDEEQEWGHHSCHHPPHFTCPVTPAALPAQAGPGSVHSLFDSGSQKVKRESEKLLFHTSVAR